MTPLDRDRRDGYWVLVALLVSVFLIGLVVPTNAQAPSVPQWHKDAATLTGHAHTTGATITIDSVSQGVNNYIYITGLDIMNCEGAAVTPAAPTFITTTGLAGNPQYMVGSGAAAAGSCAQTVSIPFPPGGLRSATKGVSVTFVLPAFVTNQVVSVNVYGYVSPF
jgi:hypothetical protein